MDWRFRHNGLRRSGGGDDRNPFHATHDGFTGTAEDLHRFLDPGLRCDEVRAFARKCAMGAGVVGAVVEPYRGLRAELVPLFAEADDSPTAIRSYIELGEVLVARHGSRIIGH